MKVAVVIPARNEAPTVGNVVEVALQAGQVDQVIVVDNNSQDDTAVVAKRHGASVVTCRDDGKGQTMSAGVAATEAAIIVFLDADLIGLWPSHVNRLIDTVVEGGAAMACGLFDRGPFLNPAFLHALPILTGQRALRREIFEALDPRDIKGYKVEAALNSICAEHRLPIQSFVCNGLWHRTKEEKFGTPVEGYARKLAMLSVASWSYLSYRLRRTITPRRRRPSPL